MRWIWIDKFIEFNSGRSAVALKNVTLAEEHLHDHFPGYALMPASLMLEGMAQTGGILIGKTKNFEQIVILAKVPKVTFYGFVSPGDSMIYDVKLIDLRDEGGTVECTAHVGERLVAEAEIVFAHLEQDDEQFGNIDQKNFVFSTNLLKVMDVGQAGDGTD
ncbi:MAG: beta-hydroxyacyl-ACP dehydratase [Planctomycetes bacterium]|nr:beta-hydroxyacyl-ACP dehydratase [Planctomycetota bacterium]